MSHIGKDFQLQLEPVGGPLHLVDLASFRSAGLPVPHQYGSWSLHESDARWLWCRATTRTGRLLAGFAIQLTASRAIPGTWIGRAERVGRRLHESVIEDIGTLLVGAARLIPRLQRLDVQLFDEDEHRLRRFEASLRLAGCLRIRNPRDYTRTLLLPLVTSEDDQMARLSSSTRRNIRIVQRNTGYRVGPIRDARYAPRMTALLRDNFRRTHGIAPTIAFEDVLQDAMSEYSSCAAGVFDRNRPLPDDLVAFAWGRAHGDHAGEELRAADRSGDLARTPLGYAVVWHLVNWARRRGFGWFDLGGALASDIPDSHPLHGINEFKRRFTTDERRIAGEFRIEPDTRIGRLAQGVRRAQEMRRKALHVNESSTKAV